MIYRIDNTLQIIVLVLCVFISLRRAFRTRDTIWTLMALFYSCWILDDLYWLLYWIFYGISPILDTANLCWYASYVFLYLVIFQVSPVKEPWDRNPLPWLGPVFAAAMAVFYIQWGEVLSNLVCGALMGLLLYTTIRRLLNRSLKKQHFLFASVLGLCLLEYGLWTASCFWKSDSLKNPYYWIDFMLTITFLILLPATKKAVSE